MRRYVFPLAILSLALLGRSAARGDDQQIAQQIIEKLQAEKKTGSLKGFSIDLQVDEGTVWLSGRVANESQQARALDLARRVPGVQQVVNDLTITEPPARPAQPAPAVALQPAPQTIQATPIQPEPAAVQVASEQKLASPSQNSVLNNVSKTLMTAVHGSQDVSAAAAATPIGSGVDPNSASSRRSVVQAAQPIANVPQQPASPAHPQMTAYMPMQMPYMVPVYAGSQMQVPLAVGPARASYNGGPLPAGAMPAGPMAPGAMPAGVPGSPMPSYLPGSGVGIAPARYDHPTMPGYAWPSYAAYPNYASVTYPKQYSPTAWPYIGPFYPYPQVPLGWRKVTLEWDDGWWFLDFKDRRTMYNH